MKKYLNTLICAIALLASLSLCSYAAERWEDKTFEVTYTTDSDSGCVTAEVEVANTSALPQNAIIIVGMYDSDGNMHSVSYKKCEVAAASNELLASEPTEKHDASHTPRTFVWDSSLKPLEHGGELHTVRKNAFISGISVNGEKAFADNNSCVIWVSEQTDLQSITVSSINLPQGASYSTDEGSQALTVTSEDGLKSVTYTIRQTNLKILDFEDGSQGVKLDGWSISGNSDTSAFVKSEDENKVFCLDDRSTQSGKIGAVYDLTDKLSAPYTVSYKIKYERPGYESGVNDASSCWFHLRDSSNNTVMSASARDNGAYLVYNAKSANGEKSAGARMKTGIWHEIKMTCVSEDEALFYLDGELVYSASPLVLADLARLSIFTTDARICTMYIDDIAIYSDSYAAELKAAYEDIESQFSGVLPWIASLYDPHTGGFYTTVSGRDGAQYVPSLESTAFVYAMMTDSETGLLSTMPDEFKTSLISYFQNAQSDEDGFFYDYGASPDDYGDRAKMRVYQQCVNKLSALGAEPLYALPSERLSQSASLMSQTDAITLPAGFPSYLATVDEFIAKVESRNWDTNSWTAGDLTYEDTSYLIQLGQDVYTPYIDALFEWLENRQNSVTGYWAQAGDTNFNALSGAFKVVRIYDRFGVQPPNSGKICNSIIQTLFSGEAPASACDIRNFLDIFTIIKKYDADLVINALKGNELSIVKAYAGFMKIFFKADGGASINQNTSTASFGGIPAGEKLSEGDIDGTQQMFLARYYLRRLFGKKLDNSAFAKQYDAFWAEIENKNN